MTLEAVVRQETAQIVAYLVRMLRDVDRAEELFQETVVAAAEAWAKGGMPQRPGAWLMASAKNRAIDALRRDKKAGQVHDVIAREQPQVEHAREEGEVFPDERLRLIFTCCHPALAQEAQVALTLRLVAGLTTAEVARAFVVSEPTIAQRLVRAKRLIREKELPYEVPDPDALPPRLAAVLQVLYLVFNEGYTASSGDSLTRVDLKEEAMRLARLVVDLLPQEPEARSLLALMQLHASRAATRVDEKGDLVLMEHQDRKKWDQGLISEGVRNLEQARRLGPPGPYGLHAHIAESHATAPCWEQTPWERIAALYAALEYLTPNAVLTLNRAVAISMVEGPDAALRLLDSPEVAAQLREYHLLHATRADLLRRLGRKVDAAKAYRRAHALTSNARERAFLERRIAECDAKV